MRGCKGPPRFRKTEKRNQEPSISAAYQSPRVPSPEPQQPKSPVTRLDSPRDFIPFPKLAVATRGGLPRGGPHAFPCFLPGGPCPPLPLAVLGQNSIAMAVTNITPPQIRTSVTGSGLTLCSVPRVARRRLHQPQQAGRQLLSPKRRLVTHSTSGRRRGTHNETPGNPTNQTQPPPPYHRRPNRRAGNRAPLLALPPP